MWYGNSLRSQGYTAHSEHRLAARRSNPTYSDILEAANAAVRVFESQDLLVLDTTSSQEQIKRVLVNANSRFYLIPARDPLATYKVLWYRTALDVRVKVDLLQPGIMSIPNISSDEIERRTTSAYGGSQSRIPVAPFGVVLLLKLQAWEQHRDSSEYRFREKQYTDARDINVLLPLAVAGRVVFDSLPDEFVREARRRVALYTRTHPTTEQPWQQLGFEVTRPRQVPTATAHTRTSTGRYTRHVASQTRVDELAGLLGRMGVADGAGSRTVRSLSSWVDYD
ncbi:hypothetical protein FRC07_010630 [Ceratobasidium sp. 392]|nr:hypothetical protein FRC07_010630 [Ceratobasidium sp. 392]